MQALLVPGPKLAAAPCTIYARGQRSHAELMAARTAEIWDGRLEQVSTKFVVNFYSFQICFSRSVSLTQCID